MVVCKALLAAVLLTSVVDVLATSTLQRAEPLPDPAAMARVPPDVERFVREALRDRLLAGDIPDLELAVDRAARHVYVRAEMPASQMTLTPSALPQVPQARLTLIRLAVAQQRVARTGERIAFLTVDRVQIARQVATVWLGADFIAPLQPGSVKMCCCESEARFVRHEGRWVFVKWGAARCV